MEEKYVDFDTKTSFRWMRDLNAKGKMNLLEKISLGPWTRQVFL